VAVAALAILAGCGDGSSGSRPADRATVTPAPTAAAAAPPVGRRVSVRADDGRALRAHLAPGPRGAPALIVLHTSNNARDAFNQLTRMLHGDGYTLLTLEARYKFHSYRDVTPVKDERAVARDVLAGARYLRAASRADISRIGIIAQSMGAIGAIWAITRRAEALDAVAAISPPDSGYVLNRQRNGTYAPRNILFVTDERERPNAENLIDGARRSEIWQAPIRGHGYELLADPRVPDKLREWLGQRLCQSP
jgi:hypothetical protein